MEYSKRKLVTAGCSYTNYMWPTWADFLGASFDTYINAGKSGGGNRLIYNNLMYLVRNKVINENDLVIVQWSALSREDRMKTGHRDWTTPGNLDWQDDYSDEFVQNYFSPIQQALELLNYAESLKTTFNSIGCEFVMFNMFDWHIDDWFGEPCRPLSIHKQRGLLSDLKLDLQLENFIHRDLLRPSLDEYKLRNGQQQMYVNYQAEEGPEGGWTQEDGHPGPLTHLNYLLDVVIPKVSSLTKEELKVANSAKIRQLATKWNNWCSTKELVQTQRLSRHLNIYPEGLEWPTEVWNGTYVTYDHLDVFIVGKPETQGTIRINSLV